MVVHSECRSGLRLRLSVSGFWETLDAEDAKAAAERYERMKATAVSMAATAATELAPAGEASAA